MPDRADRVADGVYTKLLTLAKAAETIPIGNDSELALWRVHVRSIFREILQETISQERSAGAYSASATYCTRRPRRALGCRPRPRAVTTPPSVNTPEARGGDASIVRERGWGARRYVAGELARTNWRSPNASWMRARELRDTFRGSYRNRPVSDVVTG